MKLPLMNKVYLFAIVIACSAVLASCSTVNGQSEAVEQERPSKGQRKGPPPEAFTACDGLSSGASCTVTTPRGEMSGTCMSPRGEDELVCAPAGGRSRR